MNPIPAAARLDSVSSPSSRAGAVQSGVLSEFFRYHGAWAPGIRLFRSINFQAKALVISAVFLVPIAVLAYSYFSDKASAIAFSASERLGVSYVQESMPLLEALQQQRLWLLQETVKGTAAPELQAANTAVEAGLKRLAAIEARLGRDLSTGQAHAALVGRLQSLPPSSAGVEKVLAAQAEGVAAMITLITTATDNSNLTLDPDLDTYYLMDGAMFVLPGLIASTGHLGAMSNAAASGMKPTAEQLKDMHAQEVLADVLNERLTGGLDKIATIHPDIKKLLAVDGAREAMQRFYTLASAGAGSTDLVAGNLAAISGLVALQRGMTARLDELLQVRIGSMERSRNLTIGMLLVSLCVVWYLFLSFRKVLDGGLKEVAFHIDAMRGGDLTTRPTAWGADEAAGLMHTLVDMQQSLRRIVSQVRGASENIVQSSSEIASGSMDLSSRTEQSAANLEESASAMEQISGTVRQTAESAQQAAVIAKGNAEVAARGGAIIGTMVATMNEIRSSSHKIGDIIGTIDGIAFQTNILALNAAVEAARAGDAGRGFAVVASEVRQLAMRSAAAAREIKGLINDSVEKVESGTTVVKEAGSTIDEIVLQSRRVNDLLAEIAIGAKEQAVGVQQTTQAVHEMDTTTQENAALVEQTASAAASLREQARSLAGEVAQFKLT